MGISYLPTFTVEKDLEEGSLCAIETDYDHMEITAVCAHHKNKWLSPVMQVFIDLLTNAQKADLISQLFRSLIPCLSAESDCR